MGATATIPQEGGGFPPGPFSANLIAASPDGSSGALAVRAMVSGDLPQSPVLSSVAVNYILNQANTNGFIQTFAANVSFNLVERTPTNVPFLTTLAPSQSTNAREVYNPDLAANVETLDAAGNYTINGNLSAGGDVSAAGYRSFGDGYASDDGSPGFTGVITIGINTITVKNGLITAHT